MKKIISPILSIALFTTLILLFLIQFQRVDAQSIYKCDNEKFKFRKFLSLLFLVHKSV